MKSLTEMHGGQVRVKSAGLGHGSSFSVELPLLAAVESEPDVRVHPTRARWDGASELADEHFLEGVHVLVVDDEPDARELVRHLLQACSARVVTAGSVADAFDRLRADPPHLLVSDIGMPVEDGYGLIRRVRALPAREGGDVPAIALTAFARSEDRRKVLLAGFQAHLAKPVEPSELVALVASLTGKIARATGP